jgi:hypothetical protein
LEKEGEGGLRGDRSMHASKVQEDGRKNFYIRVISGRPSVIQVLGEDRDVSGSVSLSFSVEKEPVAVGVTGPHFPGAGLEVKLFLFLDFPLGVRGREHFDFRRERRVVRALRFRGALRRESQATSATFVLFAVRTANSTAVRPSGRCSFMSVMRSDWQKLGLEETGGS